MISYFLHPEGKYYEVIKSDDLQNQNIAEFCEVSVSQENSTVRNELDPDDYMVEQNKNIKTENNEIFSGRTDGEISSICEFLGIKNPVKIETDFEGNEDSVFEQKESYSCYICEGESFFQKKHLLEHFATVHTG